MSRPSPEVTPFNAWFWHSGQDGQLRIQGCSNCGQKVHPPVPICPACGSTESEPTVVSGRATVIGFTVNRHPWLSGFEPPYVIANVALEEDAGVRLTTNLINVDPSDVAIGQVVRIVFEPNEDVWIPLFEPTGRWTRPTASAPLSGRCPGRRSAPSVSSTGWCCRASAGPAWAAG